MTGSRWVARVRQGAVATVLVTWIVAMAAAPPVVELQDAWVRWVPSVVPNTALYGVIVNHSDEAVQLVGGMTPAAKMCKPMITVKQASGSPSGPVMTMQPVDALQVPAHGRLVLEPGGDHLMVMGLVAPLEVGTDVHITLRFDGADPLQVDVPVAKK